MEEVRLNAKHRYYLRNREKRLEQMKEVSQKRRNRAEPLEERAKRALQYQKSIEKRLKEKINGWLGSEYDPAFKAFIRTMLLPFTGEVNISFLRKLEEIAENNLLITKEDGTRSETQDNICPRNPEGISDETIRRLQETEP